MQDYVAGFLIDEKKEFVLLIEKRRPVWQAGRLNGIGGHVEKGETPQEAMHREFYEEVGLRFKTDWHHFCTVAGDWGRVFFYRRFTPKDFMMRGESKTDEKVILFPIAISRSTMTLPNLSWLIPLAAYTHDTYLPPYFAEVPAS